MGGTKIHWVAELTIAEGKIDGSRPGQKRRP